MPVKYLLSIVFFFYVSTLFAQTKSLQHSPMLKEGEASSVGVSEERLARLDVMLNDAVAKNEIPGAVALIVRNGVIIYHKAFGLADNETKRTLKRDDIFRIASQTKAITSTAVMMLWEEGKFQLDDPISKFIPEFSNAQVLDSVFENGTYSTTPAKKQITIRHLLTHTSGIGYGVIDGVARFQKIYKDAGITDLFTTEKITIAESVKKLAKLPLHHNPGEKFTYSESIDVLGYLIEVVSGMPLDKFFRTRILDPLGMEDTWFYLPESKHERLVSLQKFDKSRWIKYPVTFYDPDYPIKGAKQFFSGGAGLSSTAKDYATFLQMYLNKGEINGVRILSRTTVDFILANQIGNHWGDEGAYFGLAFGVIDEKGEAMGGRSSNGTFEWGGYFNTKYFADPKENIIAVLLKQTQQTNSDNTEWKFRLLVGAAIDD
jgi:CubicO group peptidase (beta-lactamase class C family)